MAISDLPGYVQGYKFDDTDSLAWDGTNEFFIDQAGYSAFPASRLEITTGTPSFVDVNSARGLVLDNTVQGFLNCPVIWKGSMIVVMGAPGRFGANGLIYPLIGGGVASVASNARLQYRRVSAAEYRHDQVAAASVTVGRNIYANDGIYAGCFALDQQNRYIQGLKADGTLYTGSTVADNQRGLDGFKDFGTPVASSGEYGLRMRFGNLSGTQGDTAATSNTMIICELHFFNDILTAGDTTAVEAELTALETIYG